MITPTAAIATRANAMSAPMFGFTVKAPSARRCLADDAREDDEADAVADAALGDELADPHQRDRAGGQRRDLGQRVEAAEVEPAGQHVAVVEQREEPVGLEQGHRHGQVARVLGDLVAAVLALRG